MLPQFACAVHLQIVRLTRKIQDTSVRKSGITEQAELRQVWRVQLRYQRRRQSYSCAEYPVPERKRKLFFAPSATSHSYVNHPFRSGDERVTPGDVMPRLVAFIARVCSG